MFLRYVLVIIYFMECFVFGKKHQTKVKKGNMVSIIRAVKTARLSHSKKASVPSRQMSLTRHPSLSFHSPEGNHFRVHGENELHFVENHVIYFKTRVTLDFITVGSDKHYFSKVWCFVKSNENKNPIWLVFLLRKCYLLHLVRKYPIKELDTWKLLSKKVDGQEFFINVILINLNK